MTFPVDQFTSLPPTANAHPRAATEDHNSRDYNKSGQGAQDVRDNRTDNARNARDLANARNLANERSDFQRHLEDRDLDDRPAPATPREDHGAASAQDDMDQDALDRSSRGQSNHGYDVSQAAKEPVTTEGQATGPGATTSKGETVRTVASSKVTPGISSTAAQPADTAGPGSEPVAVPGANTALTDTPPVIQEDKPASAQHDLNSDTPSPTAGTATDQPDKVVTTASAPPVTTQQTSQPKDGAAEQTSDGTESTSTSQESVVAASTEVKTKTATPANQTAAPPEGAFNANAQKTEDAVRPGWGAENAPRSERGAKARGLKSGNAELASANTAETSAVDQSGPQSPSSLAAGKVTPGETEAGSPEQGDETTLTQALAPGQDNQDPAATPQDTLFGAPVLTGKTTAGNSDAAPIGRATIAEVNAATGQGTSKGTAGANAPTPGGKLAANAQANKATAQTSTPAQGGTPADTAAQAQAQAQAQTQAQANANAAPNASPTGVAKALASGQGSMPLGSAPSAEQVTQALAGIDKRGTRQGTKSDAATGNPAVETTSKAKSVGQSSAGTIGQPTNAAGQATNAAANNQATQSQAGQNTATQAQPSQFGQTPTAPVIPDPSTLASGTGMATPHGGASMEVDPVTGALHMTGSGSARMAGPSLSEVTMQFSRARMIQTPAKEIAVQVAKHLSNGVNRFDIRISPPEMGRIEVRLEITDAGKVTAHLVADKPETLDLLQKDRATLEKALAEAGLDSGSDGLNFSMREGKGDKDQDLKNQGMEIADEATDGPNAANRETLAELEVSAYGFDIVRMKRLDISI